MKKVAFFLFFSSFLFVNLHALECDDLVKKESFKTTPNELAYANEGLFYCDGSLLNLKEVKELFDASVAVRSESQSCVGEGVYEIFKRLNARTEVPGCSLCMGNQARVNDNAVVFSTSTRNFDNRMGMGAKVYLGSAELAAVCALLGRLPSVSEYKKIVRDSLSLNKDQIYKYLNFNEISEFSI